MPASYARHEAPGPHALRCDGASAIATSEVDFETLDRATSALWRSLAALSSSSVADIVGIVVAQSCEALRADRAAFRAGDDLCASVPRWVITGTDVEQADDVGERLGVAFHALEPEPGCARCDFALGVELDVGDERRELIESALCIDVRCGERVFGRLYLVSASDCAFGLAQAALLERLAERVAFALEIARIAEDAQEAIRSRDTLLAIVSHDLRSPLSAISLSAGLLAAAHDERTPWRGHKQVRVIRRAVERMTLLIEDLLLATALEGGQFKLGQRAQCIFELMHDAMLSLEPLAHAHSLALEHSVEQGLVGVVCNRERIVQVLSNLVGNAVRFTPAGGTIRIEATSHGAHARFAVSDTGVGIPAHKLPFVFDRYWKGEPSGRHGVGLGLYIAKGIVEAHQGQIWAESVLGEGTCFHFTLPAMHASSSPA